MIATKIIFSDSSVTLSSLYEATGHFMSSDSSGTRILMEHAVESITNQQWIENAQLFVFENAHTVGIINYSADQIKADLFTASLSFWHDLVPSTTTVTFEQTPVDAIPAHAVPILWNGAFYLDPQNIDLDPEVIDYFLQSH
jgi:hypothetical protein